MESLASVLTLAALEGEGSSSSELTFASDTLRLRDLAPEAVVGVLDLDLLAGALVLAEEDGVLASASAAGLKPFLMDLYCWLRRVLVGESLGDLTFRR